MVAEILAGHRRRFAPVPDEVERDKEDDQHRDDHTRTFEEGKQWSHGGYLSRAVVVRRGNRALEVVTTSRVEPSAGKAIR